MIELRTLAVAEAHAFRDRVLRPDQPEGGSVYANDDAPDTRHWGAFVDGLLAAVATICCEPPPGKAEVSAWRLRGMATLDRFRGQGLGRRLAESCLDYARRQGGTTGWCTARISAVGFYEALAFRQQGSAFRLPEYSEEDYVLMAVALSEPESPVSTPSEESSSE